MERAKLIEQLMSILEKATLQELKGLITYAKNYIGE